MPARKKEQPKIQKSFRLDFMITSSLTEYAKKNNYYEADIVEQALLEFFKGKSEVNFFKAVGEQLEIISGRMERMEAKLNQFESGE